MSALPRATRIILVQTLLEPVQLVMVGALSIVSKVAYGLRNPDGEIVSNSFSDRPSSSKPLVQALRLLKAG